MHSSGGSTSNQMIVYPCIPFIHTLVSDTMGHPYERNQASFFLALFTGIIGTTKRPNTRVARPRYPIRVSPAHALATVETQKGNAANVFAQCRPGRQSTSYSWYHITMLQADHERVQVSHLLWKRGVHFVVTAISCHEVRANVFAEVVLYCTQKAQRDEGQVIAWIEPATNT